MSEGLWIAIAVIAIPPITALVVGLVRYRRRQISLSPPDTAKPLDRSGGYTASSGITFSRSAPPAERIDTTGLPAVGDDATIPRDAFAAAAGPVGGVFINSFGSFMESSIIGPPPDTSTPVIPNMGAHESARFVLNALLADGVSVDGIDSYLVDDVHHDGTPFQRIGSLD